MKLNRWNLEKQRSKLDWKIYNINEELEDKDSDQHATAAEWSLNKKWKFIYTMARRESRMCLSTANCHLHHR